MRRVLFLVAVVLALPLAAQQYTDGQFRLSLLATDLSYTESDATGSNVDAGFAVGLAYQFSPRWAAEASYGREEHSTGYAVYNGPTFVTVGRRTVTAEPFEVSGLFNFTNDTRWKPYVGFGARYIAKPDDDSGRSETTVAPIVSGGVHFQITPTFSLRAEGKAKIGNDRYYDPTFKSAIGVGWRF